MVRDFTDPAVLVTQNLPRRQCSIISRLLCGILPLEIEVGRFKKEKRKDGKLVTVKREHRYCKLCKTQNVEDETHFIVVCEKLKEVRDQYIEPLLLESPETNQMSNVKKLGWLLDRDNLKRSAEGIEALFVLCQSLVFNKAN